MCNYCNFIKENDFWQEPEVLNMPFTITANNIEMDLGHASIELSYCDSDESDINSMPHVELQLCFYTNDDVSIKKTQIHYCPFCGENLDDLIIDNNEHFTRTATGWEYIA